MDAFLRDTMYKEIKESVGELFVAGGVDAAQQEKSSRCFAMSSCSILEGRK